MEQARRTEFTADEFIAWALEQATGRFELDNGAVVAMAPERVDHTRTKRNVTIALHNAIGARELPCEVLPDGASVRVNDRTVYEPDALIRCGPLAPGGAMEVGDPVVVVEVVSPSSRGIDTGAKLAAYFSLPNVRHYLIVDTDKRVVIHHRREGKGRDGEGDIRVRILGAGQLSLDPPGLSIDVRDLFHGI
jgi:Uma2 family endonuclease